MGDERVRFLRGELENERAGLLVRRQDRERVRIADNDEILMSRNNQVARRAELTSRVSIYASQSVLVVIPAHEAHIIAIAQTSRNKQQNWISLLLPPTSHSSTVEAVTEPEQTRERICAVLRSILRRFRFVQISSAKRALCMSDPPSDMPGISLGLARITTLLSALKSPQLALPIIHISGTNGKGSISSYIASILAQSGLRVAKFNSPHLVDEWDCLEIAGATISQSFFESAKRDVAQTNATRAIGATSFELLTATAFEVFRRQNELQPLDLAVVEVGMGGLTDATNVVPASHTLLSIVAAIELDHQKFLGDTITKIARVKGGIVKEGTAVVLTRQAHTEVEHVLKEIVDASGGTLYIAGEGTVVETQAAAPDSPRSSPVVSLSLSPSSCYPNPTTSAPPPRSIQTRLPLPGSYQLVNAATAIVAIEVLRTSARTLAIVPSLAKITDETIAAGVEATCWRGRLDWITLSLPPLSPRTYTTDPAPLQQAERAILLDGAHNPSSAIHLASYLASLPPHLSPTTLIIALSSPRPPLSILLPLLESKGITKIVATEFTRPEGMQWIVPTPASEIAELARSISGTGDGKIGRNLEIVEFANVEDALRGLREERILIAGSLYLVADVYRLVRKLSL